MTEKIEIFKGIVELAKQGYKPSDINDILERLETDPNITSGTVLSDKISSDENISKEAVNSESNTSDSDIIASIIERNNKD